MNPFFEELAQRGGIVYAINDTAKSFVMKENPSQPWNIYVHNFSEKKLTKMLNVGLYSYVVGDKGIRTEIYGIQMLIESEKLPVSNCGYYHNIRDKQQLTKPIEK